MSNETNRVARREVLRGTMTIGLGLLGVSLVGAGCGKKEGGAPTCNDTTGLKPEEVEQRKSLKYADKAVDPKKDCTGCKQFVAGPAPNKCGTCKVLKGSVSPLGGCDSWVDKNA